MNLTVPENINILIVDDSEENVIVLEQSLEREGINIFTTTSSSNALALCMVNDIAIALVDVRMPYIDGFELLNLIKQEPLTQHIMVILITGYSMNSADVVKGLSNGAVDYLFKPLDLYITIAKVNSLIAQVNYQREIKRQNIELENSRTELFKAVKIADQSRIAKENFLANMSHEIRTPLNSISGLTYLLKESDLDNEQRELIRLIEYSSKALLGIVDDILESSKIDAGKIKISRSKTNVAELVTTICELLRPLAGQKGLSLISEIDPRVPAFVMADPLRLNQILINLVNNAIKFTPSGSVSVFLKEIDRDDDRVTLEFTVKDTGLGIPQDSLETIFNRFEQIDNHTWQKFEGTGLGLTIVKSLVELKGGTLEVESEVNEGTAFIFKNRFALADQTSRRLQPPAEPSALSKFEDTVILLAEDNPINQFLVVQLLKKWNIRVDVAYNGLEAIEKLQERHYDLILMDTHMPVLDGLETTRRIRQEMPPGKRDIPVISFSASVVENDKIQASKAGVTDFIAKPFEPAILHQKISKLIRSKETEKMRDITKND